MGSGDPSGLQNRRELASLALVSSTLTRFRQSCFRRGRGVAAPNGDVTAVTGLEFISWLWERRFVSWMMEPGLTAPFEIDSQSGALKFPALQLTLEPNQSREAFLATAAARLAQNGGLNDGWQRDHFIRQPLEDGRVLGVSLYFFHDRLVKVTFDYRAESEADWSNWSREREISRAAAYKTEIVRQLGPARTFHWGIASAGYDDKAGAAILFVKYSSSASSS